MLPGKNLTPTDVAAILKRRIWLLVLPPLVMGFAALVYSSGIRNVYQADMLIAVDPQRVPGSIASTIVTLDAEQRMNAISVQVLSRTNLERTITTLGLYEKERETVPMEDVVTRMRDNIAVEVEKSSREGPTAFHVKFTHPDPDIATKVTQQLGDLFVEQNTEERRSLAGAANDFLDEQLVEARKRLEVQERKVEEFRQRYGKALPTQMQSNLQALQSLQMQVQSTVESIARDRDRRDVLERLYRDSASEPQSLPSTQSSGPGGPAAGSAQQQLQTAKDQLATLELRYTPDHPDVNRLKRLIADLAPKAAAEQEAAKLATAKNSADLSTVVDPRVRQSLRQMQLEIESLDKQIRFKEATEARLRGDITDYQSRLDAVPGLESEWVALTRDYETQQQEYKELLSKSGAARVSKALEDQRIGETFRIVDPARVPVNPLPSTRGRINVAGLMIGLLLGLLVAAGLELRDRSFRSQEEVVEILSLPVLASVPLLESVTDRQRRHRRTSWATGAMVVAFLAMTYVTWTLKLWNSLT